MKHRSILFLFLLSLAGVPLAADGGAEEILVARALPAYAKAVPVFPTDRRVVLTKDAPGAVKRFFDQRKQPGDRFSDQGSGFTLSSQKAGASMSISLVEVETKEANDDLHPALGELKAQSMMGRHSEAEYQALEAKYKRLSQAFFRQVEDEGKSVPEGELIYRKAYRQAHGASTAAVKDTKDPGQKAKAQEMRKQMQAMKAKGDLAGIMKAAQSANTSPGQTAPGAAAMAAASQDTWDLWIRCLQDLEKAAYWTRIRYAVDPQS